MIRAATARSTHPDRSSTAKRASLSASLSSIGAVETTTRMNGIIRMLIQKPRVRTFSRYSRVATSKAFAGSGLVALLATVVPDGAHEDLVQRPLARVKA